jgi:hypothetical protein
MLPTSVAALGTIAGTVGSAEAALTFTFLERGNDVVGTGSGTIDLAGLPPQTPVEQPLKDSGVEARMALTGTAGTVKAYTGITGPSSFGSGGSTTASNGGGAAIAVHGADGVLGVPQTYVSGNALSNHMEFAGKNRARACVAVAAGDGSRRSRHGAAHPARLAQQHDPPDRSAAHSLYAAEQFGLGGQAIAAAMGLCTPSILVVQNSD